MRKGSPPSPRVRVLKFLFGLLVPFLLLPLLFYTQESRCGYVILLMACYWVVEPIPVAATSLLPVVLFPLLGVISTEEASRQYMNGTNMMFVGGLFIAVAIEGCNLHKRIALNVLKRVGPAPSWMMFGMMATSMFLSMWISNTATAALMVPIVEAVIEQMGDRRKASDDEDGLQLKQISVIQTEAKPENGIVPTIGADDVETAVLSSFDKEERRRKTIGVLKRSMFLAVAYSANIGGTGTLTGTGPNLVVKAVMEKLFPESNELSFVRWMFFNVPVMVLCVAVAWLYLFFVNVRKASVVYTSSMRKSLYKVIVTKHEELGPMTFQEKCVTVLFCLLVMLWVFRDPHFIKGWGFYFPLKVSDATAAIGIPALLFLIPADPARLGRSPPILEWKTIQQKVPWGVIILLGGGFALATASEKSGLSKWLTLQLLSLNISSPLLVVTLLTILTAFVTEFTSNVATANVLLPVVAELAVAMQINPVYLMIPVTIACSFAFMLPVATPPNAIVYEASDMTTLDMMKPGLLMNLMCVFFEVVMINTLGKAIFDMDRFPAWANTTLSAS